MPDHEHQDQSRRPGKKRKSRLPIVLLIAILLLAIAGGGLYLLTRPAGRHTQPPLGKEETGSPPPAAPVTETEQKPARDDRPVVQEVGPPSGTLPLAGDQRGQCSLLAKQLHEFFRHVDQQDYLRQFNLSKSSQAHFIELAERLLANPPVVTREADDLYTILQNMAHFFRVIGKDNILLIKTILDRERDKIEDVAGELYQWVTLEGCQEELLPFSPPLAEVYEYAGFFLNTMGGRSYLFRRDSRSRLLVNYYSILIVDRANGLGINRHGIDISQPLPQLIEEIESSTQLIHKEKYLDRLYKLQDTLPH